MNSIKEIEDLEELIMKKRIISAIIAALIVIPIVYYGGFAYRVGVGVLAVIGYTEFLMAYENKRALPIFVKMISYITLFTMFAINVLNKNVFDIDYKEIIFVIMVFLIPIILYHDDKTYNTTDALYLIGGTIFLSLAFSILYTLRERGIETIIYLVAITISADTFAYFTGVLFGKHKMIPSISPNKTWEGALGGTLFSVLIATIYYINYVDSEQKLLLVVLMTLFLTIISQFGDLVFSAMKRHSGIKDFSNIMPGHGGILDRLDSLILVMLAYMLIL